MKLLAVESTSMAAGAALIEEDRLLGEIRLNHRKTHSEQLLPMVDQLLTLCQCPMESLEGLAVSVGPGSFTGIRIGVATVKGLAQALNLPVVGVSTLETLAWQVSPFKGRVVPLMDAQRNLVYTAGYQFHRCGEAPPEIITPPDVLHIQELLEKLISESKISQEEPILFTGDALPLHEERLKGALGDRAVFALPIHAMPSAAALAQCGLFKMKAGEGVAPAKVQPVYLRTSQAEKVHHQKELLKKAGK
ncbi:tRNA (adenosine(37)-N6)-threonylcarbamoyltransferase complex dimerization subunit type 1 TsaB [Anoxynatronum buryatiense]|uniref:tRNA threonylcarbamoyladenosine biosynthesis protein TsaB n=1 Tax=Anoxynatronum buryatiense TaxID=489973 RepID=A0AA45WZ98_9CLOT|nr:tRNA (adenosine(37)-N6)-threonylcarbamoyltransferase complex dimerization subunit type 1 TsaB [Anoxynatronum buryatiense]SMP67268.1 tRNA threonylcarbamoyladenosine biosynthesis protein TsaB [Anoxynatronum buryatiense]